MQFQENKLFIQALPDLSVPANEALNTLWTNLTYSGYDMKVIGVTSCHPNEGKSFTSMYLASMITKTGRKVLLIDADLRQSVLAGRYKIATTGGPVWGLVDYLSNQCSYQDTIYETDKPLFDMVLAGHNVLASYPLLESPQLDIMISELRNKYDVIIIDTPPIGAIIDAAIISRSCDGMIFVVKENFTTRQELLSGKRQIEQVGGRVLGVVLNDVNMNSHGMKKYYRGNYSGYYTSGKRRT